MGLSRRKGRSMDGSRRTTEEIDLDVIKEDYESDMEESERLQEAGDQYELDKLTIEALVESVENSDISNEDKMEVLKALRADLERVDEGFREEVVEKQDEIDERQQERMEKVDEAMDTYQDEIDDMEKGLEQLEIAPVDFREAIDAAQGRIDEFESFAEDATKTFEKVRQTALEQRARMLGN